MAVSSFDSCAVRMLHVASSTDDLLEICQITTRESATTTTQRTWELFNPLRQAMAGPNKQSIAPDVTFGRNVKVFAFANLYGCVIGDDTKIGAFVEIQKNATIGARCKISSHTFVCEGVTIEEECFIGHHVCFTNDLYPRATAAGGGLQTEEDWQVVPTLVKRGASIGSGAVILAGVTIGE